jgi:transcriptional regulator with XRE-family HTH domain
MTDIKRVLGTNIRTYRTQKGLTQEQLAEMVDMATNYLGLIEGGKKFPSADMLDNIAAALGKDTIELFTTASIQQDWKEATLLKVKEAINNELNALNNKK